MNPNDPQGLYNPGTNPAQPAPGPAPATPSQQIPQPTPAVQPVAQLVQPSPVTAPQPAAEQQPIPGNTTDGDIDGVGSDDYFDEDLEANPITWTAQEFVNQEKSKGWFIGFGVVIAGLVGLSIWTSAISFAVLLVVIAVVVVVYAKRPPRNLNYTLDNKGLTIDSILYKYQDYKAFGVINDGGEYTVMLIPVQRFQPGLTIHFPQDQGEDIVDVLGSRLPMRELHLDVIDRIVRLLRL